jgi:hypothetical protein
LTSIYSGIVRMPDLALGTEGAAARNFFLVAPGGLAVGNLDLRYLPYSELRPPRGDCPLRQRPQERPGRGLEAGVQA